LDNVLFKVATAPTYCLVLSADFLRLPHVEPDASRLLSKHSAWGEERDESLFDYEQIGGGFITDGWGMLVELVQRSSRKAPTPMPVL
jgi:hypothetical protein